MSQPDREEVLREEASRWGLSWGPLEVRRDGQVALWGTALPAEDEAAPSPTEAARCSGRVLVAGLIEARVGSTVTGYDWSTVDAELLGRFFLQATFLDLWAMEKVGSHDRLLYSLLLAEGGGILPFMWGTWYLAALPHIETEVQRREGQHEAGSLAGVLSVCWKDPVCSKAGLQSRPEVENTVETLQRRVWFPPAAADAGMVPEDRLGQIALTLDHEIDAADPIRTLADGFSGGLDHIPHAVSQDIKNEAEKHRRWEGRTGDHAEGPARLEVGLDIDILRARPEVGRDGYPREQAFSRVEPERALAVEAHAVLRDAEEARASGRNWKAQRALKKLYNKLGGTKERTPEVDERPSRKK